MTECTNKNVVEENIAQSAVENSETEETKVGGVTEEPIENTAAGQTDEAVRTPEKAAEGNGAKLASALQDKISSIVKK
ncbi:MAG: hypothetical protein K2M36_02310, partial [Clostridia bacterium]|nr:hypothetical protein [Clostridia bacterium]